MSERIIKIFDTTLRDGEQAPGASMTIDEKLEMAKQLAYLNVDIIEAGFAISSKGDFEAIKTIAQQVKGPIICSLARAVKLDIETAWEAVKHSARPRIHTFIATSPVHMEYKLKKSPEEVLQIAINMVKFAKSLCADVEFSAEDASRSEPEFLFKIFTEVIKAGATVINVPDTVGYAIPEEFGKLIKSIKENVEGIDKVDISVHCHNDLGLATANSLSAIRNGASQIEVAVNGIGERAGNASLEEVVMSVYTRKDLFKAVTNINSKEIYRTSKLLTGITGIMVQPNKAIVGENAFLHEAGIHQDGVLKHRATYEIMSAEIIGLKQQALVLGKHSGRHAFKERLQELGFHVDEEQLQNAFEKFKILADEKKVVSDKDIESIVAKESIQIEERYKLEYVQVTAGNTTKPTATVRLVSNAGEILEKAGLGSGPVDAIYNTIEELIGRKINLQDYIVHAVTGGTDALGEVTVRIKENGEVYTGRGSDTDILVSSAQAFLSAVNKLFYYNNR
ncbi:MAG: 2-isopropylmalate synthase [Candidatus Margulisbacteria bacterium]|nr:2-isopropylmalate synthase [Candidatus Margulisiibacteriota bacterium]